MAELKEDKDKKPVIDPDPADEMLEKKDDHVISEGPTEDYHQKITRISADGKDSKVTYFDRTGKELAIADNLPGNPGRSAEGKHPIDPRHSTDPRHADPKR